MSAADKPANETERVEALHALELLDTLPESEYDDMTALASHVCGTPMALISLVDQDRQWFKSRVGVEVAETPRELAFCAHAILAETYLEVPDATQDARFADNPLVTGDFHLRFYAGVPLVDEKGHALGTICVLDTKEGALDDAQRAALQALGRQIMHLFELRAATRSLNKKNARLRQTAAWFRAAFDSARHAVLITDAEFRIQNANLAARNMLGLSVEALGAMPNVFSFVTLGVSAADEVCDGEAARAKVTQCLREYGDVDLFEAVLVDASGREVPVSLSVTPILAGTENAQQEGGYFVTAEDIAQRLIHRRREEMLARIDAIVLDAQQDCLNGVEVKPLMQKLLDGVLDICECEYGFIGEIVTDDQGMHLHTFAITDIAWDEASRAFYDANIESGMIFRNHQTLFGHVMTSGEALVSNDPATDPRRGGLPPGHPHMASFCGMPVYFGKDMVGMVGLANRTGGFEQGFVEWMQPLTGACGTIVNATRLTSERQHAIDALTEQQERTAAILYSADDSYVEVSPEGRLLDWNETATNALGLHHPEHVGTEIQTLIAFTGSDGGRTFLPDLPSRSSRDHAWVGKVNLSDGRSFPAEVLAWRQKNIADGSTFAFIRDITARVALEAENQRRFRSETLLKEVHHRVKNNMQVVSSMLGIQSHKVRAEADRAVFRGCRERIRAMAAIHERLYATGSFDRIAFADYLHEVVPMLVESNTPPDCSLETVVEAAAAEVDVDIAVPLSLILAEVILNATKHAFVGREQGKIEVKFNSAEGTCVLELADDGWGDAHIGENEGTGMTLIRSLVRQIRGSLQFNSRPGIGTTVCVSWFSALSPSGPEQETRLGS